MLFTTQDLEMKLLDIFIFLYNTGMDLFCRYQISGWCILCICRLLSFCSSLHFDFNKEMFNLVSNKLCKMFHLAFGTTSSLFSSKTHTA